MGKYYPTAPKKNGLFKRNVDNEKNVDNFSDTYKRSSTDTEVPSNSDNSGAFSKILKYLKERDGNVDEQVPSIDEYMRLAREQEDIPSEEFQVVEEIVDTEERAVEEVISTETVHENDLSEDESEDVAAEETISEKENEIVAEQVEETETVLYDNNIDEAEPESQETETVVSETVEIDEEEQEISPIVVVNDDDDPLEQTKVPVATSVVKDGVVVEDIEPASEEVEDGETVENVITESADEAADESKVKQEKYFARFRICMFAVSALLFVLSIVKLYEIYYVGNQAQSSAEEVMDIFEQKLQEVQNANPTPTITPKPGQTWWPTPKPGSNGTTQPPRAPESDPIAKLAIDKINIKLPVLPYYTEEMLKVSICKYYGGDPNGSGNFVISGHNYRSGAHFGKLKYLKVGDKVKLTDLSGKTVTYSVYEIITIKPEEPEKLETGLKQSLTMVTCSSNGKLRLVVKCKPDKK